MAKRNNIFDTVKSDFKLYGFQQIETPLLKSGTITILFRVKNFRRFPHKVHAYKMKYVSIDFLSLLGQHKRIAPKIEKILKLSCNIMFQKNGVFVCFYKSISFARSTLNATGSLTKPCYFIYWSYLSLNIEILL